MSLLTRFVSFHQLSGTTHTVYGGGHDAAGVTSALAAGVKPGQGFAHQRFLIAYQTHRTAGAGLQARQYGVRGTVGGQLAAKGGQARPQGTAQFIGQ